MFRLVSATLLLGAHGQPTGCPDCAFDLTALEEFSTDFHFVTTNDPESWPQEGATTAPMPADFPIERGSIAVNARNMQLKLDSHATIPPNGDFNRNPLLQSLPLAGMEIHEELHLNGATGQASFHVESPVLNLCFQLDHFPPVAHIMHDQIDMQLQQAEQIAPMIFQQHSGHINLDGQEVMYTPGPMIPRNSGLSALLFTDSSHPALLAFEGYIPIGLHHVAVKFDGYSGTTGNQFGVRACEIESHTATQSLLAANPKARDFVASRIAQHQRLLQGLLEPEGMNTRFNFIPLEFAESMMSTTPACTNDELVQSPGTQSSTSQVAVLSVTSFVMGVAAAFAAIRKKHVTPADDYHQVTA